MAPLLSVHGLTVNVGSKTVLDNVSFRLDAGEPLVLVGPSGSGKSTLALSLAGLLHDDMTVHGRVVFDGVELAHLQHREWQSLRGRRIAIVGQDVSGWLDPVRRVGSQLAEAVRYHDRVSHRRARARSLELLIQAEVPSPEDRIRQYPHQLSGGLRQRVAIALAMAGRPELLIADEPTSALDVDVERDVLRTLRHELADNNCALLLVTHDLDVAGEMAKRVVMLDNGCVTYDGSISALSSRKSPLPPRPPLDAESRDLFYRKADVSSNATPFVRAVGVHRRFGLQQAVDGVDLEIHRGETLGLVGESGSGKSTLGRLLLGLDRPDSGSIRFDDVDPAVSDKQQWRKLRRRMQLVFQDPYASLDPRMTVGAIVGEPMYVHGMGDVERRVVDLLEHVQLDEGFSSRRPHQLSGGQRQRVGIARALASAPEFLVLDEPVASLDAPVRRQILELLAGLQEQHGLTYLFISHDLAAVRAMATRVVSMRHGRIA